MSDLDKTDRHILSILETQGRIAFAELAEQVGLSKTPCWNRVKVLQKTGLISGYSANVNHQMLGLNIQAVIHVVVDFTQSEAFEDAMLVHKHVMSCLAVTGDYDYVLKVIAHNVPELDSLLRKDLSRLPGVTRFSTAIATRSIKDSCKLSEI